MPYTAASAGKHIMTNYTPRQLAKRIARTGERVVIERRTEMELEHISYLSRLYGLKTKSDACLVRAFGMQAENSARETRGEALAYNDLVFNQVADEMDQYAIQMMQI